MNNIVKIGLIGLGGIAGFALAKYLENDSGNSKGKKKAIKMGKSKNPVNNEAVSEFPLKLGSKGIKVKRLQVFLMRKLGVVRKPTGVFDKITLKRVKQWFKSEAVNKATYDKLMLDKMVHDQRKIRSNGRQKK